LWPENRVQSSRTRTVRVFPNEASPLGLVTAALAEIDEDWSTTDRVYINMANRDD
jgi:transposase-like protein